MIITLGETNGVCAGLSVHCAALPCALQTCWAKGGAQGTEPQPPPGEGMEEEEGKGKRKGKGPQFPRLTDVGSALRIPDGELQRKGWEYKFQTGQSDKVGF